MQRFLMMRGCHRWAPMVWALATLIAFGATASAHTASLTRTEPVTGAHLAEAPVQIALWFSEELSTAGSAVQMFDAAGRQVDLSHSGVDLTDPYHETLVASVPALGPGIYTVCWRAVLIDGDETAGAIWFAVGVGYGAPGDDCHRLLGSAPQNSTWGRLAVAGLGLSAGLIVMFGWGRRRSMPLSSRGIVPTVVVGT